jgi:hypothetical protein
LGKGIRDFRAGLKGEDAPKPEQDQPPQDPPTAP